MSFREVVLGEHKLNTDPDCSGTGTCAAKKITRNIANIIKHENYDISTNANDIALIRLNEPVPLTDEGSDLSSVSPICLPWSENDYARKWDRLEGETAVLTGWGRSVPSKVKNDFIKWQSNIEEFGVGAKDGHLRVTKVNINNKKCGEDSKYAKHFDPKTTVCTIPDGNSGKYLSGILVAKD